MKLSTVVRGIASRLAARRVDEARQRALEAALAHHARPKTRDAAAPAAGDAEPTQPRS